MFLREVLGGGFRQESLLKSFKFERLQLSRGFSETHVSGRGVRVLPSSENQETLPFRVVFLFELVNGTRIGLQFGLTKRSEISTSPETMLYFFLKKTLQPRVHEKGTSGPLGLLNQVTTLPLCELHIFNHLRYPSDDGVEPRRAGNSNVVESGLRGLQLCGGPRGPVHRVLCVLRLAAEAAVA